MSSTNMRGNAVKRSVALIGAGAMVAGTFGFAVAPANAAPVRADLSATCEGLEGSVFTDIANLPEANRDAIGCLSSYGFTTGLTSTTYGPSQGVTRQQMAIFVSRLADYVVENSAIEAPTDVDESEFDDRDELTPEGQAAVDLLATLGVVRGDTTGDFSPERIITRAEMSAFINRLQNVVAGQIAGYDGYNPQAADVTFDDVPVGSPQGPNIYALQSVGIVQGTSTTPPRYSPAAPVTRAQMAFFLMRHLDENIVAERVGSLVDGVENFDTLTVSPSTSSTLTVVPNGADDDVDQDADRRTYTASGLQDDVTYRVTLVDADNIQTTPDGTVTFRAETDENTSTGFGAAVGDQSPAELLSINNGNLDDGDDDNDDSNTATATPVAGNITFVVDGQGPGEVVPVVYINGGPGGGPETGGTAPRLEVRAGADGQFGPAAETFGIGGTLELLASELDGGDLDGDINTVDKDSNRFEIGVGNAARFVDYDANDAYFVDGVSVGLTAFETALSTGDAISGSYTRDADGVSTFLLDDANPATVAASADADSQNVTVSATFPGTLRDLDEVVIQRAPVVGNPAAVGTFATIATVPAADVDDDDTNGVQVEYLDVDVPVGTYQYRVAGINDGQRGDFGAADEVTTTAPVADTTAPMSDGSTLAVDAGFEDILDRGDVFTIRFTEPMALPTGGALRLQGSNGIVVDVIAGTNATFTLNQNAIPADPAGVNSGAAAGTVLTVTLTAAPEYVSGSFFLDEPVEATYPAAVVNSSGVTDEAGNRFDVTDTIIPTPPAV